MTLKELSQLYWLNREIENDQRRLEELEARAGFPSLPKLTGMPAAPHGGDSQVERMVAELVDLQAVIAAKQIQCIHERARLERYISSIPDSLTRLVFQLRFVNGLSWEQVAESVGGNTVDSVKKICYRYLNSTNKAEKRSKAQDGYVLAWPKL